MSEPFKGTAAESSYSKTFSKAHLGSPGVAQRVKSIPVFDKIRCKTCREVRKKDLYSENQLNELRYKIYHGGKQVTMFSAQIKCKMCTGLQPNQMLCFACGEVKTLNDFAKAQRHSPDNARCKTCIQFIAGTEPGLEVLSQEDDDSDLSGEEYNMQVVDHALQGLEIQTTEPRESSSSSTPVDDNDKFTPGDGNGILGGKRALHGSITSKSSMGPSNSMTAINGKENRANNVGGSLTSGNGVPGGGVPLNSSASTSYSKTIGEGGDRSFFNTYDNEGYAYLRQAEYYSDEENSVSEFTDASRGGWGKIKNDDDLASAWTSERGSSSVKAIEPTQKIPEVAKTSYFKGKMVDVDDGDDDLPEL